MPRRNNVREALDFLFEHAGSDCPVTAQYARQVTGWLAPYIEQALCVAEDADVETGLKVFYATSQ